MLRIMIDSARHAYAAVRRMAGNVLFERPAGIDTASIVHLDELGLKAQGRVDYHPTPWLALKRVMPEREITEADVFIDFGCGKGRVLYQAAMYRFGRVIGVELSPELAAIARHNIERSRAKLVCRDIEVFNTDVLEYEVPDDVTYVYFFNPFKGEIFEAVVQNLLASLRRRPRELTIIYMDPAEEAALLRAGAHLVKATWGMRPTKEWARGNSIHVYKLRAPVKTA
jgi:SAM-dependent methyltransferase